MTTNDLEETGPTDWIPESSSQPSHDVEVSLQNGGPGDRHGNLDKPKMGVIHQKEINPYAWDDEDHELDADFPINPNRSGHDPDRSTSKGRPVKITFNEGGEDEEGDIGFSSRAEAPTSASPFSEIQLDCHASSQGLHETDLATDTEGGPQNAESWRNGSEAEGASDNDLQGDLGVISLKNNGDTPDRTRKTNQEKDEDEADRLSSRTGSGRSDDENSGNKGKSQSDDGHFAEASSATDETQEGQVKSSSKDDKHPEADTSQTLAQVNASDEAAERDERTVQENAEPSHSHHGSANDDSASSPATAGNAVSAHHTAQRKTGLPMLAQVISQTRPVHLPPKSREEDELHLERWKAMMEESKQAETRKRHLIELQRKEREDRINASMPVWSEIVRTMDEDKAGKINWSDRIAANGKYKQLWHDGVPSHIRGKVWSVCVGNGLALPKDSFKHYLSRAKRAISNGRFPEQTLKDIERDARTALPITKLFVEGSPLLGDLIDLLQAWYVTRTEEGLGYISDVHLIAAMLLINMDSTTAFIALRNLLERPVLRAFFQPDPIEIEAYFRVFEGLASEALPKVFANCVHLGVRLPSSYFTTLFLHQLSIESASRIWDIVLLEGDGHIFRIEPRLYFPDAREVLSIIEGQNPATRAIVEREKERARQRGLPYISETDGVLTDLGVNASSILEAMAHDNWKEGRYSRLLERELPE